MDRLCRNCRFESFDGGKNINLYLLPVTRISSASPIHCNSSTIPERVFRSEIRNVAPSISDLNVLPSQTICRNRTWEETLNDSVPLPKCICIEYFILRRVKPPLMHPYCCPLPLFSRLSKLREIVALFRHRRSTYCIFNIFIYFSVAPIDSTTPTTKKRTLPFTEFFFIRYLQEV